VQELECLWNRKQRICYDARNRPQPADLLAEKLVDLIEHEGYGGDLDVVFGALHILGAYHLSLLCQACRARVQELQADVPLMASEAAELAEEPDAGGEPPCPGRAH
jgi:hypothetical protein